MVGSKDIFKQWSIQPPVVEDFKIKVRDILNSKECDVRAKTSVRHTAEDFAGSLKTFWELDWAFLTWASGGMACMRAYPNFKGCLTEIAERRQK